MTWQEVMLGGQGKEAGEGVAVPEADGNRVGLLGAHQPRDNQVLLVSGPTISWR